MHAGGNERAAAAVSWTRSSRGCVLAPFALYPTDCPLATLHTHTHTHIHTSLPVLSVVCAGVDSTAAAAMQRTPDTAGLQGTS